jgi:hypothetical protein
MTGLEKIAREYMITVRQAEADCRHRVIYAPRGLQHARGSGGPPAQAPASFEVVAQVDGDDVNLRWENPPKDRDATQEDFEQDARGRVRMLHNWLARLCPLVRSVETWARELGWATRLIDKRMEDSAIGKYQVPALLMQEGTDRILLEPIGRSSPGTEGVVDLWPFASPQTGSWTRFAETRHFSGASWSPETSRGLRTPSKAPTSSACSRSSRRVCGSTGA